MNRRNQTIIIASVALIIIAIVITSFIVNPPNTQDNSTTYSTTEQKVTIKLPEGVSGTVYSNESHNSYSDNDQGTTVNKSTSDIQLKPGSYTLTTNADQNYQEFSQTFTVNDQPLTVTANPSQATSKLENTLIKERFKISEALYKAYPQAKSLYSIKDDKLYLDGSWYAAKLIYKGSNSSQNDTLRFVAKKQDDGTWKIITTPPDIIVSIISYPEIPKEVATDINNFR